MYKEIKAKYFSKYCILKYNSLIFNKSRHLPTEKNAKNVKKNAIILMPIRIGNRTKNLFSSVVPY